MKEFKTIGHCVPCKNKGWLTLKELCEDCIDYREATLDSQIREIRMRMPDRSFGVDPFTGEVNNKA